MEKEVTLTKELRELEREVESGLARANRTLADGLQPLIGSSLSAKELSARTFELRWQWQDQLASIMRQYVQQLLHLGDRHQVPEVPTWIETQLRNRFRVLLEEQLETKLEVLARPA